MQRRPTTANASATPPPDIAVQDDVAISNHEGVALTGHLHLPAGPGPHPAVILINGGGWQKGDQTETYRRWARFLARSGYAVLTAPYRSSVPERPMFRESLADVRAALTYLREHADELGVDPDRIAAMGDSAGAHLAAMLNLGSEVQDASQGTSSRVHTTICVYGVFDLIQQWEHDQVFRPQDQITQRYLHGTPMNRRREFYEASPLFHASEQNAEGTRWLLIWGPEDEIVDNEHQTEVMARQLTQAGAVVRKQAVPGYGHFWFRLTPVEVDASASPAAFVAPRIIEFLDLYL